MRSILLITYERRKFQYNFVVAKKNLAKICILPVFCQNNKTNSNVQWKCMEKEKDERKAIN